MITTSETATETECAMKVTSYGSQYSTPASMTKIPTTPQEGSDQVPKASHTDLNVVSSTLATIQEHLNESAEVAMLPSPPINTPVGTSPEPSVVGRNEARNSVFGEFGDRIAEVLFDSRNRRVDIDSVSNQSVRSFDPSADENDAGSGSDASDEMSSSNDGEAGDIPICLGSPRLNPLIEEYKAFQRKGVSTENSTESAAESVTEPDNASTVAVLGLPSAALEDRTASFHSEGGVTEKSNWADECEEGLVRALHRLEQLVRDEARAENSNDHEQRYVARLARLLEDDARQYPIEITATSKAGRA